ncbi:hypothetical protein FQN57_006773 [Myotisia sp. PD_48]|nr:hypothetical protein FQN57_006773 [Myotisia sp. PD_48]
MTKSRPKSLSHGRPPAAKFSKNVSLSSKATRNLIRSHHQLHKSRARALAEGNEKLVSELDQAIASRGGLESYQLASKKGQSKERGGDSSKVLLEWLDPELLTHLAQESVRLRLLEVGALSSKNACSGVKCLDVTRVDLNSQEAGILQQDFMERPLPETEDDRFHIISLSLVLNYVPDSVLRGEMLRRTSAFLTASIPSPEPRVGGLLPSLFLVLPAACVLNSRYLTEERLGEIMSALGYKLLKRKVTTKLIYYLWQHSNALKTKNVEFKKEILSSGRERNNFSVILKKI